MSFNSIHENKILTIVFQFIVLITLAADEPPHKKCHGSDVSGGFRGGSGGLLEPPPCPCFLISYEDEIIWSQ